MEQDSCLGLTADQLSFGTPGRVALPSKVPSRFLRRTHPSVPPVDLGDTASLLHALISVFTFVHKTSRWTLPERQWRQSRALPSMANMLTAPRPVQASLAFRPAQLRAGKTFRGVSGRLD